MSIGVCPFFLRQTHRMGRLEIISEHSELYERVSDIYIRV